MALVGLFPKFKSSPGCLNEELDFCGSAVLLLMFFFAV